MDPLTLVLYVAWYVVSRLLFFVCNVVAIWIDPERYHNFFNDSQGKPDFFFDTIRFAFYVPAIGDVIAMCFFILMVLGGVLIIVLLPGSLAISAGEKVAEISKKRQLRLKESDKVGLLSEVEK